MTLNLMGLRRHRLPTPSAAVRRSNAPSPGARAPPQLAATAAEAAAAPPGSTGEQPSTALSPAPRPSAP
jgi:hypothetical protein